MRFQPERLRQIVLGLCSIAEANERRFVIDTALVEEVSVPLDTVLLRLTQALARLEDAVERRLEADDAVAGHAVEVQALAEDRARLARRAG